MNDMTGHSNKPQCLWCENLFTPRCTGGRAQKFCSTSCRQGFHTAARTWAVTAVEQGDLSVDDLKAASATCTLDGAT